MYDSMKSVTHDLNGDGEMGERRCVLGASVDEYSAAGFYISAGGTQTAISSDGTPSFLFNDPNNYSRHRKNRVHNRQRRSHPESRTAPPAAAAPTT